MATVEVKGIMGSKEISYRYCSYGDINDAITYIWIEIGLAILEPWEN